MTLEIILLGLALAIDAAVVSFTLGLLHMDLHIATKSKRAIIVSMIFGFFQFLMLWIGSLGGHFFTFSKFGHMFHFVVGIIFILLALKFVQESLKEEEEKSLDWGVISVIILAVVTSIDSLLSGISLGTIPQSYFPATIVGIITFFLCLIFYFLSQVFKSIPDRWLLRLAAGIFIGLGSKIFLELGVKGII